MKNPDGSNMSPSEMQGALDDLKTRVTQAGQAAKNAGNLPGHLEEILKEYLEPSQSWLEVLTRFLGDYAREDYSMCRPNRRHLSRGFCMPSLYNETFGKVLFAVDTSGSVSEEEVHDMFNEIMGTIRCYEDDPEITVICCDTGIRNVQKVSYGEDVVIKGGGGTRFSPVMEWVRNNMHAEEDTPVACIYHTDGYCNDFGEDPGIPVLWALSGDHLPVKDFKERMPFGEVVLVGQDNPSI